jgi:hypothetical protein
MQATFWTDEFYFLNQPGQADIQTEFFACCRGRETGLVSQPSVADRLPTSANRDTKRKIVAIRKRRLTELAAIPLAVR